MRRWIFALAVGSMVLFGIGQPTVAQDEAAPEDPVQPSPATSRAGH